MSWSKDNLLQLYIEGNLTPEAKVEFDRLVQVDSSFSESLVGALAADIGPAPDTYLDQAVARMDDRYDQIFNMKPAGGIKLPTMKLPTMKIPSVKMPTIKWPTFNLPSVNLPGMPAIRMPNVAPETVLFAGGLTLFSVLFLIALLNPFQKKGLTLEEQTIQNFKWSQVPAREEARPIKKTAVQKALVPSKARSVAKHDLLPPKLPVQAGLPTTAEGLVELAMKSAPGGVNHQWVETTAPRAVAPAMPPMPADSADGPSFATARGNVLRLAIPLQQDENVKVKVADSKGRIVRDLFAGHWTAGSHTIDWDVKDDSGKSLKAGEYAVLVETGGKITTQKVTIK